MILFYYLQIFEENFGVELVTDGVFMRCINR